MSRLGLWLLCFAIGTGVSSVGMADRGDDDNGHGWGNKKDWKKSWDHGRKDWERRSRWGYDAPYITYGRLPRPGEYGLWYPDQPPGYPPPPQPWFMLDRAVVVAYAVPRLPSHATIDTRIQQMAIYDLTMRNALQMPTDTPEQRGVQDRAIADARIQLSAATHRRLNPVAVSRIDAVLGLPATDPQLGVR
jgi:hypothetical protein